MSEQKSQTDDVAYRIGKLDLKADDILVVKYDGHMSAEMAETIRDYFGRVAPGNKVMVIDRLVDLAVLTRDEIEQRATVA